MAADTENMRSGDKAREHLARSRALGEEMRRHAAAVSHHLRLAAKYRRQAIREARRRGRY